MKLAITLFILIISFGTTYSQPFGDAAKNFRIVKQVYQNSSEEVGSTVFSYNNDSELVKAFWSLENEKRSSTNFYEHNAKGQLISAHREFSDGITSSELFQYDSIGNLTTEYFFRSDNVAGSANHTYVGNTHLKTTFNKHKGWLTGTLIFQYDSPGKKQSAILSRDEKEIATISYLYDDHFNLIEENWDFMGKWSQKFTYIYEQTDLPENYYSSPYLKIPGNYRIVKEDYTFNNEIGGPSFYFYDADGLLYKKTFIRSDSVSTTTFYQYDHARKLLSSSRSYTDGSPARFEYDYDETNNLVVRSCIKGDSLTGFESYLYNSDGILIKAYLKNFDNWLTGTIQYTASETGQPQSGRFTGENGLDALIEFKYNEAGLLSDIVWSFSSGKFQKYNFEYQKID